MKILFLMCNYHYNIDLSVKNLGGTETWCIEMAKRFSKYNDVTVCCEYTNPSDDFDFKLLHLCNINELKNEKFDAVIINAYLNDNVNFIVDNGISDNIYVAFHLLDPMSSIRGNVYFTTEDEMTTLANTRVKKIICVSTLTKLNLQKKFEGLYDIFEEKCVIIKNGVNNRIKNGNISADRDNRILWSIDPIRGLETLINDIYPLIKKDVPDFGIDVCYPSYCNEGVIYERCNLENKDVRLLGSLDISDVYQELSKHKVWFHPEWGAESFSIARIDAMLCGNLIISPFRAYHDFPDIMHSDRIPIEIGNNKELFVKLAVEKIKHYLTNYNDYNDVIKQRITYLNKECTWDNTYNELNKLLCDIKFNFDKIYCLHLSSSHERYESAKSEFKKIGVDGKVNFWITSKYPQIFDEKFKENGFNSGAVACALNHYQMMKSALDMGHETLLLFEDDVKFTADLSIIKQAFDIQNFPKDWDCIKFHWNENMKETNAVSFVEITDVVNWTMVCYLVNKRFMKAYVEYMNNKFVFADHIFGMGNNFLMEKGIKVYGLNTKIIDPWCFEREIKYDK